MAIGSEEDILINMADAIINELHFYDEGRIVVFDRLGMESTYGKIECARNVYLLGRNCELVWQVVSDFDSEGNPFTHITLNTSDSLIAYRWDGGVYIIDKESGFATPCSLLK